VKICNFSSIDKGEKDATSAVFMVGTTEYAIKLGGMVNVAEEIAKMEAELQHLEGFLKSVMAKLGNEKFVAHAKPEVVENERKKKSDAESKIKTLQESIAALKK
jgi:valyl-tRNA synthetase